MIGAGLAGTEATWQIANAGVKVCLIEMRPLKRSPAHHSSEFAELVCSNSFGALSSDRAAGLLQEELRRLGSWSSAPQTPTLCPPEVHSLLIVVVTAQL